MSKELLIQAIERYQPHDQIEAEYRIQVLDFLATSAQHFDRSHTAGHITGSGVLLNQDHSKILLHHHKALNKWIQFGGHADGVSDIFAVALRETQEESGNMEIKSVCDEIFDIDVHIIPFNASKNEPQHFHYDIRYLFHTEHESFSMSQESTALKWVKLDDVLDYNHSPSFHRLLQKLPQFRTTL